MTPFSVAASKDIIRDPLPLSPCSSLLSSSEEEEKLVHELISDCYKNHQRSFFGTLPPDVCKLLNYALGESNDTICVCTCVLLLDGKHFILFSLSLFLSSLSLSFFFLFLSYFVVAKSLSYIRLKDLVSRNPSLIPVALNRICFLLHSVSCSAFSSLLLSLLLHPKSVYSLYSSLPLTGDITQSGLWSKRSLATSCPFTKRINDNCK